MKKILFSLLIGMFLISMVSALDDSRLIQVCGGDSELYIGCLDLDENLTFLSREVPPGGTGGPGGGGSWVTPPGTNYTHISFDVFGTNTGDYPVTNMIVVGANPIEFKDALPTTTQSLAIGETNKLLWVSDLINTTPLEAYPQPITFWVNISGDVEVYTFYEQASIDLTIEPWEEEEPTPGFAISLPDISFLEKWELTKEDVFIIRLILGFIILLPVVYLIKRAKKKKRTRKEEKKEGIPIIGLKKKEKKGPLIDILLILVIIILLLSILFIPVKEEKMIGLKVHYYRNGVEILPPTSGALASSNLFNSMRISTKEDVITPET